MRGSRSLFKAYKRAKILKKRGERTIKRLKKKDIHQERFDLEKAD